jgi:carbon-monoxide dehydrogenase medium subunit/xanthine dehydrogenase FAD-binding subunit
VPLDTFYTGKGQVDMKTDEMITFLRFENKKEKRGLISFEKLGLRNALAISRISVSVYAELDEKHLVRKCRIGSGSIGLTPGREPEIEDFVTGKRLDVSLLNEAADQFEIEIEKRLKGRGSMPFKKQAIRGVIKAALEKIMEQDRRRSHADVQS